jgi:hypothetical protein
VASAAIPCSREVLPPTLERGLVDVQAFAQFVLGLDDQMDVRVFLIGVEDHGISMHREVGLSEIARGRENLLGQRGVGRRLHDVVGQLGFPRWRLTGCCAPILAGGQLQVSCVEKGRAQAASHKHGGSTPADRRAPL